jgi:hypothetical protein
VHFYTGLKAGEKCRLAGLRGCNGFESSILVLQRNSKVVTSSQLSRYFKRVADVAGEVEIQPILRPTDIMKVKMLPVIRKIHIASTIVDAMTTLENIDENTRQVILSSR